MLHLYPLDPEGTMLAIRQESRAAQDRASAERRARAACPRASRHPADHPWGRRWLARSWRGRPRRRDEAVV
jgi:hypothetical protein